MDNDANAPTSLFSARAARSRPSNTSPIWEDPAPLRALHELASRAAPAALPPVYEATLRAILDAPLRYAETSAVGFARKETELGNVLASLTILESRELHARLLACKAGDALAETFARLTFERRTRLLAFLADARRRAACAGRAR